MKKKMCVLAIAILLAVVTAIVIAATGTGLTGSTTVTFGLTYENEKSLSTAQDRLGFNTSYSWTYGTEANKCNLLYHGTHTLADNDPCTVNLFDSGTLTDSFGNALTMTAIKLLYLKNNSSDATLEVFGGDDADLHIIPDPNALEVHPGGIFFWVCPTEAGIVTSENKNLYLKHDGTGESTMDVDIVAMGLD